MLTVGHTHGFRGPHETDWEVRLLEVEVLGRLGCSGERVNLPRRTLWKKRDLIQTLKEGLGFQ